MSNAPGTLNDLKPDQQNARQHGQRNVALMVESLREVGASRSIVIDEDGIDNGLLYWLASILTP